MSKHISPAQLAKKQAKGEPLAIIDVRSAMEFRHVHVPGAINLPLHRVSPEAVREVADGAPVYVICKSGHRAAKACGQLAGDPKLHIELVKGGTDGWVAAGLEVVRGESVLTPGRLLLLAGALFLGAMLLHHFVLGAP